MAEVNIQQGQTGQGVAQPENGQASNNQQQTGQDSEPKWLSYIPDDTLRKEAREGWMRDADYRKKTMEIGAKEKSWETEKQSLAEKAAKADEFDKWYREAYQPFYNQINSKWDVIQKVLSGQSQDAPQASAQQQDYFANYDLLPPTEQAKKLTEHIQQNYLAQALQAQEQKFNQTLQQREGYYQNYMNILTDAFGRKFQNPGLDLQAYLQKALELQAGKGNPLDLAYSQVTHDANQKQLEEQWYKKGKEDAALEAQNQQVSSGALEHSSVPSFRVKAKTASQIEDMARAQAIKSGIPWS